MVHVHMLSAMDEWNVMNNIYKREASQRRKKSYKISEYYLEVHHVLLLHIRDYIYEINNEDITGIPNNLGTDDNDNKTKNNSLTSKTNNPASSPHFLEEINDQNNYHP